MSELAFGAIDEFSCRLTADGRLLISWKGRHVRTLRGAAALHLTGQLEGSDEAEVQLLLARNTGNFKRGNERRGD